jgi:hypothetical protein
MFEKRERKRKRGSRKTGVHENTETAQLEPPKSVIIIHHKK